MAIPLNYQISEFDCGPTSLLNALNVLFDRKLIQPCILKAIYTYTLDSCDAARHAGQHGTSAAALRFIGAWLNEYGDRCGFPIRCESLPPEDIHFGDGGRLDHALAEGAVAVTRCILCCGHYVLLTGIEKDHVRFWDPYHVEKRICKKEIELIKDHPYEYNRRVPFCRMNRDGSGYYNLGPVEKRECLLIWNTGSTTL